MRNTTPRYYTTVFIARILGITGLAGLGAGVVLAWLQFQQTQRLLLAGLYIGGGLTAMVACLVISELLSMIRDIAINSFDSSDTGLTQLEMESVLTNAIRDTTPRPTNDPAVLARSKSVRSRRVVCTECGKKIKIPSTSKYKPGDTAKCPGCKSRIVV